MSPNRTAGARKNAAKRKYYMADENEFMSAVDDLEELLRRGNSNSLGDRAGQLDMDGSTLRHCPLSVEALHANNLDNNSL